MHAVHVALASAPGQDNLPPTLSPPNLDFASMSETLSVRLRQETRQAHTRAERSGLMRNMLTGKLEAVHYVALLANLYPVYDAMEHELDRHASDPILAPVYHSSLRRLPALEQDLLALAGPAWAGDFPPTSAAAAYVARIRVAAREPALLVAHAYTRYLGDLSGGQILKRIVLGLLGARGPGAVAFYEFPEIPDPGAFKDAYRTALDALPMDRALADRVVAEALAAFELNAQLFEALD
jgi:heme oxygenase